jgi:release factor glutamine methyltransferase
MSEAPQAGTQTLAAILAEARLRLQAEGFAEAAFDTRVLVGGLLGLSATEMLTGGDRLLSTDEVTRIQDAVERRRAHEPVHRILGRRAFHGLDLTLSPETLEPRPDTEVLVEMLIPRIARMTDGGRSIRLLDMGTGTGAIGLALTHACAGVDAVLSDISQDALSTAARNAHLNGVADRVSTVESDWFEAIKDRFDIIVSNPPYIVSDVIATLAPDVRQFDPPAALDGGRDGLDAYRAIAAGADQHLAQNGLVAVEIGYDQKQTVEAIFAQAGFDLIEARLDLGGNDRAMLFQRRY